MKAITREEKIISGENLTPITRKEMFLAKAAGMDIETPEPITREEMFLSKIVGGGSGGTGGVELNIAYGDTAPEDTTKLWVKTTQPSGVIVSADKVFTEGGQEESLNQLSAKITISGAAACAVGTNIYIFGGRTGGSATGQKTVRCWNTETNAVSTLSVTLPYTLVRPAFAAYGTKIYLFGGAVAENFSNNAMTWYDTILEFDTDTLTFTTLETTLPNNLGIGCACAATVGSKVYMFGGGSKNGYLNTILIFDLDTKEFLESSCVLPTKTRSMSCAPIGNKIYLFGGCATMTDILCYDTVEQSIELLTTKLPEKRICMGCCAVENVICLFGGNADPAENVSGATKSVWLFDTTTNEISVSELKLPYTSTYMTANTVGKKACVGPASFTGYLFEYNPELGELVIARDELQIFPQAEENIFSFIHANTVKVKIGVKEVYKGNDDGHGKKVEAALYKDGSWATI